MRGNGEWKAFVNVLGRLDPEHGPILAARWVSGERKVPNGFYEAALIGFSMRLQRIARDLCSHNSNSATLPRDRGRKRPVAGLRAV